MPNFVLSTIFSAKDKVTAAFGRMSAGAKKFGGNADRAFQRASRGARGFGDITKGILAAGAVQKGLGLISSGVSETTTQFASFDDAITGATARFKDIGPDAADFNNQLKIMKDRARLAGKTT